MGLLGRIIATVVTLVAGVGLLMFSMVVFAVLLTIGLGFGAYLWWKTRSLRQAVRAQMAEIDRTSQAVTRTANVSATVIEGEYVRLDEAGREMPRDDQ